MRGWLHRVADRLAAAFGVLPADRETILTDMMSHQAKDAPAYWLQLLLSMGLATLGLALGSTAVIIGAMLVSPLMGPVVDLSMGFAIGSPFLTIRSFSRLAGSIVAVVGGSAIIALILPFHEMTPQIVSRIHPNALDLAIAVLCAFAAAFTTVRAGAATSATAAGTAVGIALVPPLCVSGYGLGVARWPVATGAGLLFLANVCAILLFAGLFFLCFRFGALDVPAIERKTLADARASRLVVRIAIWLGSVFRGRYGLLWRILVPLVLVAAVFIPLARALSEVSWQVRVRADVESVLKKTAQDAVRTTTHVDGRVVKIQLIIVGTAADGRKLERVLHDRIVGIRGGVEAHVHVVAVPDATLVAQESSRDEPAPASLAAPATVAEVKDRLAEALSSLWPTAAAGPLLGWRLDVGANATTRVTVVHRGAALGDAAAALLSRTLREVAGDVVVRDVAVAAEAEREAVGGDRKKWMAEVDRAVEAASLVPALRLCVTRPDARRLRRVADGSETLAETQRLLATLPSGRVDLGEGHDWSVQTTDGACPQPSK